MTDIVNVGTEKKTFVFPSNTEFYRKSNFSVRRCIEQNAKVCVQRKTASEISCDLSLVPAADEGCNLADLCFETRLW